jgi:excisionase family DNA binding protein
MFWQGIFFSANKVAPKGNEAVRRGYRIAEAAEYMGVSPWFVELKIRSKELPALRMCRHYTILKEDMDAFLDDQRLKW